jgi:putative DNA primase/helicase
MEANQVSMREEVLEAHRALLNSNKLSYFRDRGISKEVIRQAYIGYEAGIFTYPCIARSNGLLGVHCKSQQRNGKGKRQQWWKGYSDKLPPKGHGKKLDEPAKIILFGMETLQDLESGSLVILCCGEEDALSLRSADYTALSQPGAGLLEPVYARELAGFEVVVFYDAGEAQEARKDGQKLHEARAKNVRLVEWPSEASHGTDINSRLVEDPESFKEWVEGMIARARTLNYFQEEENRVREGEPDIYTGTPDPEPLPEGLPPVAPFDSALLPEPLRGWIVDVSERMQVPQDLPAVGAIVVAASLVGRKLGIQPKRQDDWLVVPNLWGGAVGKPAMLKSPALAEVMKPLERLAAEAREAHEEAMASYEAEATTHEALKAALKDEVKKVAKASAKTGDVSQLKAAIAKQRDLDAPEKPAPKRYKTEDPTVEKLSELLRENPRGLLIHRDELSGWLRSLDKQGRESDRAFYLESWNGTGTFDVDRIGRGSLHVPALCVSILGGIQPGPLSSYVYEATRGGRGDDGLLQRFQLLVWPDPPPTWRNVDYWPDSTAKNRAYAVYEALDALTPEEFGASTEDEGRIPAVRFAPDAQEVFDSWRDELEVRLRSGELSPALESHLAKYRSLMPSLALIFHVVAFVDGKAEPGTVGLEAALQAAAWCEYLETHAGRLYESAENPTMEGARVLLGRIRKGDVKDGASTRDVYRGRHWSKLSTPEEVNVAATVLEDYGWLRVEKVETGGRPATRIHLHPTLRGTPKGEA